jgi:hypothetical protein
MTDSPTTMVYRTELLERGSVAPLPKRKVEKAAST